MIKLISEKVKELQKMPDSHTRITYQQLKAEETRNVKHKRLITFTQHKIITSILEMKIPQFIEL